MVRKRAFIALMGLVAAAAAPACSGQANFGDIGNGNKDGGGPPPPPLDGGGNVDQNLTGPPPWPVCAEQTGESS